MAGITHNGAELRRRMEKRGAAVLKELSREARTLGALLNAEAKQVMQAEIYDVPIPLKASANRTFDLSKIPASLRPYVLAAGTHGPAAQHVAFKKALAAGSKIRGQTTKGKYGKWTRSGNLKRSEFFRTEGPTITLTNNAAYAQARNALGGPASINHAGRRAGSQRQQKGDSAEHSQTRSVQWQQQAIRDKIALIRERRRAAVLRALKG